MRSEMEMEEIEAVLVRVWDLHDKISDAIHAISRAHFLHSLKSLAKSRARSVEEAADPAVGDGKGGFVFAKDFRQAAEDGAAMAAEARSLDTIRAALENLEDQLEFFHTVQSQQQAERDAAVGQLEQSRIVLAMRLADHQGKKYEVIEEALAFVGNVHDKGHFITPETLYEMPRSQSGDNLGDYEEKRSSVFMQMVISSLSLAKRSFRLENFNGVLGNAAIFAASMLAFLHLHQVAFKSKTPPWILDHSSSHNSEMKHLDVLLARG